MKVTMTKRSRVAQAVANLDALKEELHRKPMTPAEARLVEAAIGHMEPHVVKGTYAAWSWACADEALSKAVAAVMRERKGRE